jgi:hypothetical protein
VSRKAENGATDCNNVTLAKLLTLRTDSLAIDENAAGAARIQNKILAVSNPQCCVVSAYCWIGNKDSVIGCPADAEFRRRERDFVDAAIGQPDA